MIPPSFPPVRALSIFSGWCISAHFLNPLALLLIETLITVFLWRRLCSQDAISRQCRDHQDDAVFGCQLLANRLALARCAAVKRAETSAYPDRA
jgi:hypothetical protein